MWIDGTARCDYCGVEQPGRTELQLCDLCDHNWDWFTAPGCSTTHICGRCLKWRPEAAARFSDDRRRGAEENAKQSAREKP